jgi:glycine oxidase
MKDLQGLRVVVAGAGAIGSVIALALARRGADMVLADPGAQADNASAVAAGMLAPTCEALLDTASAGHHALLKAGRDAWPAFLEGLNAPALDRSGAMIMTDDAPALLRRAGTIGARLRLMPADEVRRLAPGLRAREPLLFAPDDWRLEPLPMLAALQDGLLALGGRVLAQAVLGIADGRVSFADSPALDADVLVLATGWTPGPLTPIKGQILRFAGFGPATGPVVRGEGVYAAPSPGGLIVGATMEEGRMDRAIDPGAVARLRAGAERLFPALAGAGMVAAAGVRAATADGLPVAGPGFEPGLFLAQGARRNGWLLAPLIAEVITDHLLGQAASPAAKAFDSGRFGQGL